MKNKLVRWSLCAGAGSLIMFLNIWQSGNYNVNQQRLELAGFGGFFNLKASEIKEAKASIIHHNKSNPGEITAPVFIANGLTEAASRKGWRENEDTKRGNTWLSERLIFRDVTTGTILWRMTCDPAVDWLDYYDIPAWNADGSLILFNSRRTDGTRWIMDGDGKNLRPLPLPADGRVKSSYWSVIDPLRIFYSYFKDGKTNVAVLNPFTGKETIIVSADGDIGSMNPPHPSEKWFLFAKLSGERSDSRTFVSTLGIDGTLKKLELEKRSHRVRFTLAPDLRIFFNFDDPRTTWTILPDGSQRFEIPKETGSHPGWTPGGKELTMYSAVDLHAWSYDGKNKRIIATLGNGGHGASCLDGIWQYCDTYPLTKGNYPNCILAIKLDTSQTVLTIAKPYTSMQNNPWHPQGHSTHAHPVTSPDGTKVFYNSDALSQYTDIYVAVIRPPDAPVNLKAKSDGGTTVLSWEKPFRSRETRGYYIYRADKSGLDYHRLTDTPVKDLSWKVPGQNKGGYYVATSVENSGLEGGVSNEVFGSGNDNWQGPVRIAFEAEMGIPTQPMREAIDPLKASNGWLMSVPANANKGILKLDVKVPKNANYLIWARVRGKGAAQVQCDDQKASLLRSGGSDWSWQRLEKNVTMNTGVHVLLLKGNEFDVDKILLTDDESFKPEGSMKLDTTPLPAPVEIKAQTLSSNAIQLSWNPLTGANTDDIDHYNVYSSPDKAFTISQSTIIRSPSECEMVDWGLPLNSSRYYRVTAVDRSGNESLPSVPLQASVKPFKPVSIRLTAETAKVEGMKAEPIKPIAKDGATTVLSVVAKDGRASWEFETPNEGKYAIWVLSTQHEVPTGPLVEDARIGNNSNESIFIIKIDGGTITTRERTRGPWDAWNWSPAGNRVSGTPQRFELKAGKHTISLVSDSEKANVAQVMISNDPSLDPVEGMSLLGIMPPVSR